MEEAAQFAAGFAVALMVGWAILASIRVGFRNWAQGHVTVYDYEAGLKVLHGRVVETLGPGRYATWPRALEIHRVDLREQSLAISGQEMLTRDTLPVRAGLLIGYRIADPLRHRQASDDPHEALYQAGQIALRKRVAGMALDQVVGDRGGLEAGLAEEIAAVVGDLGLSVTSARILDITLVGATKQAFAELWKAKKEGEAALERARAEQASLRALANAARMLKGNPELMNLRVLQALNAKPGAAPASVILGGAAGLVPVSRDAAPMEPAGESEAS